MNNHKKHFKLDRYLNPSDDFDDLEILDDKQKNILKNQKNIEINERSIDKINELLHSISSILSSIENQDFVAMYLFNNRDFDDHKYFKNLSDHCRSQAMKLYDIRAEMQESKIRKISRNEIRKIIKEQIEKIN